MCWTELPRNTAARLVSQGNRWRMPQLPPSRPSEDTEEQCFPISSRLSSTSKWITVLLAQYSWDVLSDCRNGAVNKIVSTLLTLRGRCNTARVIRKKVMLVFLWKEKKARVFYLRGWTKKSRIDWCPELLKIQNVMSDFNCCLHTTSFMTMTKCYKFKDLQRRKDEEEEYKRKLHHPFDFLNFFLFFPVFWIKAGVFVSSFLLFYVCLSFPIFSRPHKAHWRGHSRRGKGELNFHENRFSLITLDNCLREDFLKWRRHFGHHSNGTCEYSCRGCLYLC